MKNVIYGLIDPRTNELRYIGMTIKGKERLWEHLKKRSLEKKSYKNNWLNSILKEGFKPEFIIIEEHISFETLYEAEDFWIEYYKSIGCKLTNSTKGDKGTIGFKHRKETKENMSIIAKQRGLNGLIPGFNKKEHEIINGIEYRDCTDCKILKSIDSFWLNKKDNRYHPYCKKCHNYRIKTNYNKNKELLPEEDYNKTRIPGAHAGGQATANSPTAKAAISKKLSKPIIGTCYTTGKTIEFSSALKAKEAGFQNTNIGQAIKNKTPYRGYYWKFKT